MLPMQQKGSAVAETGYTLTRRSVVCLHDGWNLQHATPTPVASFGGRSTVRMNDDAVESLTLFSFALVSAGPRASKEWAGVSGAIIACGWDVCAKSDTGGRLTPGQGACGPTPLGIVQVNKKKVT